MAATISIHAGGPGSGCNPDKGKCGRPKGSGSSERKRPSYLKMRDQQAALDKKVSAVDVYKVLSDAGLEVEPYKPDVFQLAMGLADQEPRTKQAHVVAAHAVVQAIKDVEESGETGKRLAQFIREKVKFTLYHNAENANGIMATRYNPDNMVAYGDGALVYMNTAFDVVNRLTGLHDIEETKRSGSFAGRLAAEKFLSTKDTEAAIRECFRVAMIHEAGHVLDGYTGGDLSRDMVQRLRTMAGITSRPESPEEYKAFETKMHKILDRLEAATSLYAGAQQEEAVAEIFTAHVLGKPVPVEFDVFHDRPMYNKFSKAAVAAARFRRGKTIVRVFKPFDAPARDMSKWMGKDGKQRS